MSPIESIQPASEEEIKFWKQRKLRGMRGGKKDTAQEQKLAQLLEQNGVATVTCTSQHELDATANKLRQALGRLGILAHCAIKIDEQGNKVIVGKRVNHPGGE